MIITQSPPDGGMLYTETNLQSVFPEPLNALTAAFFLGIALYWTFRLKGAYKHYAFLSFCLVLLYIGGIGGTIYHALRQWRFFIFMDWMPIMLLCISAGLYYLSRLFRWQVALLVVGLFIIVSFGMRQLIAKDNVQWFINLNYALMALLVLLPVGGYIYRQKGRHLKWVLYALAAFSLALLFRMADPLGWFPSGTHFLWHSFGAFATHCMFQFIFSSTKGPLVPAEQ